MLQTGGMVRHSKDELPICSSLYKRCTSHGAHLAMPQEPRRSTVSRTSQLGKRKSKQRPKESPTNSTHKMDELFFCIEHVLQLSSKREERPMERLQAASCRLASCKHFLICRSYAKCVTEVCEKTKGLSLTLQATADCTNKAQHAVQNC